MTRMHDFTRLGQMYLKQTWHSKSVINKYFALYNPLIHFIYVEGVIL